MTRIISISIILYVQLRKVTIYAEKINTRVIIGLRIICVFYSNLFKHFVRLSVLYTIQLSYHVTSQRL